MEQITEGLLRNLKTYLIDDLVNIVNEYIGIQCCSCFNDINKLKYYYKLSDNIDIYLCNTCLYNVLNGEDDGGLYDYVCYPCNKRSEMTSKKGSITKCKIHLKSKTHKKHKQRNKQLSDEKKRIEMICLQCRGSLVNENGEFDEKHFENKYHIIEPILKNGIEEKETRGINVLYKDVYERWDYDSSKENTNPIILFPYPIFPYPIFLDYEVIPFYKLK